MEQKVLIVDCETTIFEKGNPFSLCNKLVAVGIWFENQYYEWKIEYEREPYGPALREIKALFDLADIVVGFNLKFDLHWLRNYIPSLRVDRVHDLQLFEFIKSNQNAAYNSLDDAAVTYDFPLKLNIVKTEYWEKGIDTPDIPWPILSEYLKYDVVLTRNVYEEQRRFLEEHPGKRNLFLLHCYDLLVLQEMEYNGLLYNEETSLELADDTSRQRENLLQELNGIVGCSDINWNSNDHISAILYGGLVKYDSVETVTRQYKKSQRTYERACVRWHELPARIVPPERSETKPTAGWSDRALEQINAERALKGEAPYYRIYSVDENTLKSLLKYKQTRQLIKLILELAKLKKLENTYYRGVPKKMEEMNWPQGKIHGQINQCRAITGRTSSSGPNLQNFDGGLKSLFPSRYSDLH